MLLKSELKEMGLQLNQLQAVVLGSKQTAINPTQRFPIFSDSAAYLDTQNHSKTMVINVIIILYASSHRIAI